MILKDSDGVPPGVDQTLIGKQGMLNFYGRFYAFPDVPYMELDRRVWIVFASPEVFVAQDLDRGNLYVVDRGKMLSLGCRMNAYFTEGLRKPQMRAYREAPQSLSSIPLDTGCIA